MISFVEWLGFQHQYRWHLNGDNERLIINDLSIKRSRREGYADAIFNTRSGKITLGTNVIMGHRCMLLTGRHDIWIADPLQPKPTLKEGFDIKIHDGVWLTSGVIVIGGVEIGENAIVLPGSVVSKSLPPNSICGGMPAKVIDNDRFRFKNGCNI
jgi:acetyltransferase-like isoleucine patch superfamily enzyme